MLLGKIDPELSWCDFVVLRMLRRWVAARTALVRPLPSLVSLAAELDIPFEVAVGLDSLFELTESCLGRKLQAECCCCRELVPDERAILALMATAPAPLGTRTSPVIPHGLPGVLCWAVATVRSALGYVPAGLARHSSARCPFGAPAAQPASA